MTVNERNVTRQQLVGLENWTTETVVTKERLHRMVQKVMDNYSIEEERWDTHVHGRFALTERQCLRSASRSQN
jgi:hypothetical protein